MRFESIWIQVNPLVSVLGSLMEFSLFSPFLNSKGVFKGSFTLIHYCWLVFAVGSLPFYSVFLGFWGITDSLHLLPWVSEPMLCKQHWWLAPSLFSHYFPLWDFLPKSPLLTIPFWEVLGVDFQFPFSKTSRFYFSDPPFGLLHVLAFSLNGKIPLCQAERSLATFFHGQIPWATRLLLLKC